MLAEDFYFEGVDAVYQRSLMKVEALKIYIIIYLERR
jgi:hypothetical protein